MKLAATTGDNRDGGGIAFAHMRAAFERSWTSHPGRRWESFCTFAGRPARLRVAGRGLSRRIAQAFGHLLVRENTSHTDLEIDLWDQSETSISCPVEPEPVGKHLLNSTSYVEFGLILGSFHDPFIGAQRPRVITWFDRRNGRLVGWILRHDQLSSYDLGKPLHFPLLLWHSDRNVEVIHAALISTNGQGVLLAGKGGAGKSTAALACLEAGFDYLGDDYIGLEACKDGTFVGHSLYSATWLMANHLPRFPRLIPHAIYPERPDQEKTLVLLSQVTPTQLASFAPIRALVLPRIALHPSAHIRPASKAEALLALAPTSLLMRPRSGAATLNKLASLAERIPCYWLDLGRDLSEVPVRVAELLEHISH